VQTELPAGRGYTTLDYSVTMIRTILEATGPLGATGTTVRVGRRVGIAEGRLADAAGKLYATGSANCLIMDIP